MNATSRPRLTLLFRRTRILARCWCDGTGCTFGAALGRKVYFTLDGGLPSIAAKCMTECFDYLFEIAVKMKGMGLDPTLVPD